MTIAVLSMTAHDDENRFAVISMESLFDEGLRSFSLRVTEIKIFASLSDDRNFDS